MAPERSDVRQPWSDLQNDLTVVDYFTMLTAELSGRSFSKAEHNRTLSALIDRPRGGVEFKHQNISAILLGLGQPWIEGYKPAANFQASLVDAVLRWLSERPDWLKPASNLGAAGTMGEPSALWIGPPPTLSNAPAPLDPVTLSLFAGKFDAAGRDERNRELGRAGEERILLHERGALRDAGRADLADRIRWVSLENDGAGFDILSFETNGTERLLEVKTTNGWERTPFHISRNECATAERHASNWSLVRLYDFARKPRAFEIRPPLDRYVELTPTSFLASLW